MKNRFCYKNKPKNPSVGVGVFLIDMKSLKLLIGKRKDNDLYGLPGGWLENGEEWEECASRELKEETDLSKDPSTFQHIYTLNCLVLEKKYHNISCIMYNEIDENDYKLIKNAEPDKCEEWFWISMAELRKKFIDKLFFPLKDFLNKFPTINCVSHLRDMIKSDK